MKLYMFVSLSMKTGISLRVEAALWRTFRGACIQRGLTASSLFEEFMQERLKKWGVEVEPKRKPKK